MFWKAGSSDFDIITKDTMLMAHVAGEVAKSLKHLSTMYTDRPGSRAFGGPEDPGYLAEDLLATEDIYHIFDDKVGNLLITKLLNELAGYTTRMRYDGVWIDVPMLNDLEPKIKNNVLELEQELNQLAGEEINWNSPTQIVDFLLDQGVKLTEKTPTGNYTVKESVMIKLAEDYPIAQKILDLREVTKEHQFYESYQEYVSPEHPYLHPKLKLAGTRTGRLSCADPNLQQVKRTGPIKLIFKSRFEGGKYGLVDLSQAELRIAALLADDEKFARALLADDVHREVASMVYNKPASKITKGERKASKAITFGLLYGGSPKGLAARSGLSVTDVKKVVKNLFDNFPGLEKFIEETKSKAIQQKYVETPFGRIRDLSNVLLAQGEWSAARQAVNTPIQSAASDIGLVIMYYLNKMIYYYKMKSRVIFGVHDSVILDIHPDEVETIIQYTQEAFQILQKTPLAKYRLFKILPIIGELVIGPSWAEVEGTNENFNPDKVILCSSIGERKIIK
jgi:DNA polymerase-1